MGTHAYLYYILAYNLLLHYYFISPHVPALATGRSFRLAPVSFCYSPILLFFWVLSSFPLHIHLVFFPAADPGLAISPRSPNSFIGKLYLETKIWLTNNLLTIFSLSYDIVALNIPWANSLHRSTITPYNKCQEVESLVKDERNIWRLSTYCQVVFWKDYIHLCGYEWHRKL